MGMGTGTADDEEMERRRTGDEDAAVEFAAVDADGGEGGGTGRVHLISQVVAAACRLLAR